MAARSNAVRLEFPDPYDEFSKGPYVEIDRRFFNTVWSYAPRKSVLFDSLTDLASLKTKEVLEIGCGNGSHGQLFAARVKYQTEIDLTGYAVKSTSTRMTVFGLNRRVLAMDAERMKFPDS